MSEVVGRHTLKFPIPAGDDGSTVTEITVRRAVVRDLRAMDVGRTQVDKTALLMARLSGLPIATIDAMDGEDFTEIANMIGADIEGTS